jgi:hypothetical protein
MESVAAVKKYRRSKNGQEKRVRKKHGRRDISKTN